MAYIDLFVVILARGSLISINFIFIKFLFYFEEAFFYFLFDLRIQHLLHTVQFHILPLEILECCTSTLLFWSIVLIVLVILVDWFTYFEVCVVGVVWSCTFGRKNRLIWVLDDDGVYSFKLLYFRFVVLKALYTWIIQLADKRWTSLNLWVI